MMRKEYIKMLEKEACEYAKTASALFKLADDTRNDDIEYYN